MTDTITILRHPISPLSKTWNADGTITGYGEAKYFNRREEQVHDLVGLSALLTEIEAQSTTTLIRGKYVGDKLARERDGVDYKPGKVRRALDYFDDQPLHALLIDVDSWSPLAWDPLATPLEAVREYIYTMLPEEFSGAGFHWQLSNSHGHASKGDTLNVHIWFWMHRALTSAQLTAYAKHVALNADKALFSPIQAHYTASPQFEDGAVDPVVGVEQGGVGRSGYEYGLVDDTLTLVVDEEVLQSALAIGAGRGARLRELAEVDPIARTLTDRDMVKSYARDGSLNIVCPFEDDHTAGGGETSTQYFLPNTGGHALGQFKCLHQHCLDRKRGEFIARLGVNESGAQFDDLDDSDSDDGSDGSSGADMGNPIIGSGAGSSGSGDSGGKSKPGRKRLSDVIPQAQHLCTDLANANRIARHFGKTLMVISDSWYTWSGKQWTREDSDVYRDTCLLSMLIKQEADGWRAKRAKDDAEKALNVDIAKALEKWGTRSESKGSIEAAIGLLKKMLTVSAETVNLDPWLLNCANGTIDLRTGIMRPHNPSDRITKLIALEYDPTVKSTHWDAVLCRITLEEDIGPTKPLARFIKRWFGYCATGSVREHKFGIFYGQGSNGKSTLLDTVAAVLGDYATTAAPGLVMASKSDKHPTEIAALFGRRMVTAHETGDGGLLREDFVKQATGGDMLTARFMREDFFTFAPTHKLQMVTNHKPGIRGQDNGIWRRILLIPFNARFGTPEAYNAGRCHFVKDTKTAEYLQAEMQGVLTWIVEGAREWFEHGLMEPDSVLASSKDYQGEQDRVLQFVEECCECEKDSTAPLTGSFGIYEAYRGWCKDGGFTPMAKTRFQGELERIVPWFRCENTQARSGGTRRRSVVCYGLRVLDAE